MALNNVGADSGTYVTGLQLRTKYNTDLENLLTAFASATAPTSPDAHMYWLDTSGGTYAVLKKRNPDNDAWIEVFSIHLTEDVLYHPGAFRILENSDVCTITHDGTDLFIKTSDGRIVLQTDEGTNTDTELVVKGKGTGEGRIILCGAGATNTLTLEVPALTGNRTVTLPDSDVDLADVGGGVGFVGCLVYPSGAQTISNGTQTALNLDSELYDTDSFHDTVTNNSRITIPADYNGKYGIFFANVGFQSSTGYIQAALRRNGSFENGFPAFRSLTSGGDGYLTLASPPIQLATGDYFEIYVYQSTGGNRDTSAGNCFFGLHVVNP